jgi:hypothetical protein
MAQACGRVMQPGSSIINISSVLALTSMGLPQAAYTASKAGVIGLTRDLAQQWTARKGIRVNAIAPGHFESEMSGQFDERRHGRRACLPMRACVITPVGTGGRLSPGRWRYQAHVDYVESQVVDPFHRSGSSARRVVVPGPMATSQSSNSARSMVLACPRKVISYVCDCTRLRLPAVVLSPSMSRSRFFVIALWRVTRDFAAKRMSVRRSFTSRTTGPSWSKQECGPDPPRRMMFRTRRHVPMGMRVTIAAGGARAA